MRERLFRVVIVVAALALGSVSSVSAAPQVRKITLKAKKYEWIPASIQVKVGQPVELTLISLDVLHGLSSRELNIPPTNFKKNQPAKINFTPTETGTFRFKCSKYCGGGHKRMLGEIVVVP
ncbi:MAG TPA: cupredoxin domain-containing protein [Thermoanaerobaculia bacterium]|jgi:cytochrome c oxidase subunit 2|nr:cupredoxin domain-containing protein [Thermoanaerobaculia bacterium]